MKLRVLSILVLLAAIWLPVAGVAEAQEVELRFYLVPSEVVIGGETHYHGPLYFKWRFGSGDLPKLGCMDYGWINQYLVLAELTQAEHDALMLNSDVFAFSETALDQAIDPVDTQALRDFFEGFNMPTDWLTPSNTYRDLLRSTVGVFLFAQRYSGISSHYPLDSNAGALSLTETTLADDGQDFGDWATTDGESLYRLRVNVQMVDGQQRSITGFIGGATAGVAQVYQDRARTVPGWGGSIALVTDVVGYTVTLSRPESLFATVDLDTQYKNFPAQTQLFFDATVVEYGFDPDMIGANTRIRQLLKMAADTWEGQPFTIGGYEF